MLLWRLPQPKREPWRTVLEGMIIVFDLLVTLWLNRHFSQHSYELIATTVACSHFAFVCFWCVTSRGTAVLRIGLFGVVVAAMFALFFIPPQYFIPREELGADWIAIQSLTQRLIITCVATSLAGIFCRVSGWRLELTEQQGFTESQFVRSKQFIPAIVGLVVTIPIVIGIHSFVQTHWTTVFNRDFSIAALGCFYGALMLCVLAVTACRFNPAWNKVVAVVGTLLVAWLLYSLDNRQHDSFNSPSYGPANWSQYTRWLVLGTLWWWLIWKHLAGIGFQLGKTDEPLLKRPKLRHAMIAMAIMAVLFSSVKSRYFDRFDDLLRREVQYTHPRSGPIKSLTFSSGISERVVTNLGRLKELRQVGFHNCSVAEAAMSRVLGLKRLESLAFAECDLSATSLVDIGSLGGLESLHLIKTPIASEELLAISQLPNLRHLALSNLTNPMHLQALRKLEHLDLSHCNQLNAAALLELRLEHLERVDFAPYAQGAAFPEIPSARNFPKLKRLTVELHQLSRNAIKKIKAFKELKTLELVGCRDGFELLPELDIEELSLRYCTFTGEDLDVVATLEKPRTLRIFGDTPGEEIAASIGQLIRVARNFDSVDISLDPENSRANRIALAAGAFSVPPFVRDSFFGWQPDASYSSVGLMLKTDDRCRLPEIEITFEDLLTALPIGTFEFG